MSKPKVKGDEYTQLDKNLKDFMTRNYSTFVEKLSQMEQLHSELQSSEHFDSGFLRDTYSLLPKKREVADKYWNYVHTGYNARHEAFCKALERTGQKLLLQYLIPGYATEPTVEFQLDSFAEDDRKCLKEEVVLNLRNMHSTFSGRLTIDGTFLGHLRRFGGFTESNLRDIKEAITPTEKANVLLCDVTRGTLTKYKTFRKALLEAGYSHLDALLLPMTDVEKLHEEPQRSSAAMAAPCYVPVLCTEQDNQDNRIQQSTEGRPVPGSDSMDSSRGSENMTLSSARESAADEDFIRTTVIKNIHAEDAYVIKCALKGKRGRALIINNVKFNNPLDNRQGAEVDVENLVELFTLFNYKLVLRSDKTAAEIRNILEKEQKHEDHKFADSFIFFILSHGSENTVSGCDNESLSLYSIVEYFDENNCPGLVGKPKLFFIQACQKGRSVPEVMTDVIPEQLQTLNITDGPDAHEKLHRVMVVSALPGFYAYRSEQEGSVFVQALCEVFKQSSGSADLLKMLTKLTRNMSDRRVQCDDKLCKPLCVIRSCTLAKEVYLLPGEMLQKFHNDLAIRTP